MDGQTGSAATASSEDEAPASSLSSSTAPAAGPLYEGLRLRPGLAMSQDGRNWARIEADHHSGALFDVGKPGEWDAAFIGTPQVGARGGAREEGLWPVGGGTSCLASAPTGGGRSYLVSAPTGGGRIYLVSAPTGPK